MSKPLSVTLLFVGVLLADLIAQAGGPKTRITVQSDAGVTSASVDVTLCGTADCSSEFDVCPNTQVNAPSTTVTTSCPRQGGFKVLAYQYAISVNQGASTGGVTPAGTATVFTENGGTITVTVK